MIKHLKNYKKSSYENGLFYVEVYDLNGEQMHIRQDYKESKVTLSHFSKNGVHLTKGIFDTIEDAYTCLVENESLILKPQRFLFGSQNV